MDNFYINELRAAKPFLTNKVTVVAIECIFVHSNNGSIAHWLTALKEPYAIIFYDETGIHCFNLEAREISLELLVQKIPGLDETLSSLIH